MPTDFPFAASARTNGAIVVESSGPYARVCIRMNGVLEESLRNAFPMLYRHVPGSDFDGHFDCDDGWEFIIRRVSARLEPLIVRALVEDGLTNVAALVPNAKPLVHVRAVGKAFGCLTFFLAGRGISGPMLAATAFAEHESLITCEDCGAPGSLATSGTHQRTVCKRHVARLS